MYELAHRPMPWVFSIEKQLQHRFMMNDPGSAINVMGQQAAKEKWPKRFGVTNRLAPHSQGL
jgi:hypothetical protein